MTDPGAPSHAAQPNLAQPNLAQAEYWNGRTGHTWAALQDALDRQLEPLGLAAQRALAPRPGERVVDVGCGAGQTSLSLAAAVGPEGEVLGLDLSRPLLDAAEARARAADGAAGGSRVRFLQADAQTADLLAEGGPFDAVYSRFGVMFFADPAAAFANLARALKPGGRLAFVCWRPFEENAWMREPLEAALPFIPPPAPSDPLAPGPFAFADPARVRTVLAAGGFADIALDPLDAEIGGGDLEQSLELAQRVGPLGAALRENPDRVPAIVQALRATLARHVQPDGQVRLPAAVWIVTARTPA